MEHTHENSHTDNMGGAHNNHSEHNAHHGHENLNKEEMKISGDDIIKFLKKIFKAGSSRNVFCRDEEGGKIFKINLILLALIFILIPFLILLMILFLIITDYSLSIEKK